MKPDWKDSPEWAQWLAQDSDGDWYWYELEPANLRNGWAPDSGKLEYAGTSEMPTRPIESRP